jgi:16S rRNA (cytosine967-C5)-methyltransferase
MSSIARTLAFELLVAWEDTGDDPQSLAARYIAESISPEDAGFARELFFGSIKLRRKLDFYISAYTSATRISLAIKTALRLGFYQLLQTSNIPNYAIVSESVDLVKAQGRPKAQGFVNAILRNYIRHPEKVKLPDSATHPIDCLGIQYSYPNWLVKRYLERFGFEETGRLLQIGNQPPPVCFFANRYLLDDETLELKLSAIGIAFKKFEAFAGYYDCDDPYRLIRSQPFLDGEIVIGDPAQSLATGALSALSGEIVWDVFAAPGGKTIGLANQVGKSGWVIASDLYADRVKLLLFNCRRCRLENVLIFCGDILQFATKRKFKYILADVPCSCTGTMRRNPDLRWRLKETDFGRLADRQLTLMAKAAGFLENGGRLIYSTCSIEPEENQQMVAKFLRQNSEFHLSEIAGFEHFRMDTGMLGTMPSRDQVDGAFIAAIER